MASFSQGLLCFAGGHANSESQQHSKKPSLKLLRTLFQGCGRSSVRSDELVPITSPSADLAADVSCRLPATSSLASTKPSALRRRTKSNIELAVENNSCSPQELNIMLCTMERASLEAFKVSCTILDRARAELLCLILQHVRMIEIRPKSYTPEGLVYLLQHLHNNHAPHLRELQLLQLPSEFIASDPNLFAKTLQSLTKHDSLQVLRLSLRQAVANPFLPNAQASGAGREKQRQDSLCFTAIQEAFAVASGKPPLKELELVDFLIQSNEFNKLLANAYNPTLIRCRRFRILQNQNPDNSIATTSHCWERASVEGLALTGSSIEANCVDEVVVEGISSLPNLQQLTLSAWKHVGDSEAPLTLGGYNYESMEISDAVIPMLKRNKIKSIASVTAYVEMPRLIQALSSNRSLRVLHLAGQAGSPRRFRRNQEPSADNDACLLQVLQRANTTLQEVPRFSSRLVQYYVDLNASGRKQARDIETTLSTFVDLLDQVAPALSSLNDLEESAEDSLTRDPHWIHSLQYGLLRESPGVWSVPAACINN